MAITQATALADFSTGIGTAGAVLQVDNADGRVGIGTTDPQADLQVGIAITMDGTAGVITASSFSGSGANLTFTGADISAATGTFTGNVSVGGTLTYEDVTNIDSVGIITARSGVRVTGGYIQAGDSSTGFSGTVISGFSTTTSGNAGTIQAKNFGSGGANFVGFDAAGNDTARILADGGALFASDVSIADKIVHTGDTNTAIRFPAADTFSVETAGSERLRIDSNGDVEIGSGKYLTWVASFGGAHRGRIKCDSGNSIVFEVSSGNNEAMRIDSSQRLLIGTNSSRSTAGTEADFQVEATDAGGRISVVQNRNDATACPFVIIGKSRGTSIGSNSILQDDDRIGAIVFAGADGTDMGADAARIIAEVDATPGSNDMPGRLIFSTTADGSDSATERLRIDKDGRILIGSGAISSPKSSEGGFDACSHNLSIVFGGSSLSGTTPLRANNATKDGRIAASHYTNAEEPVGVIRAISNSSENQLHWGGGSSIINAATDHRFYTAANNTTTGGTERMRIHSGGVVSFNNGIELGSGLDGTAANTLDDYEEGTFTPTINSGFTASYDSQAGRYTKVGNVVHFFINIDLSSISGSSSDTYAEVEGLPFTATNTGNIDNAVTIAWQMNLGNSVEYAYIEHSSTSIVLLGEPSGGSRTHWNPGQVWDDNNGKLALSGTYTTAS